jgi:hypothetical protein
MLRLPSVTEPPPLTRRLLAAPAAIGANIGAAYFFTGSSSFANPALYPHVMAREAVTVVVPQAR